MLNWEKLNCLIYWSRFVGQVDLENPFLMRLQTIQIVQKADESRILLISYTTRGKCFVDILILYNEKLIWIFRHSGN